MGELAQEQGGDRRRFRPAASDRLDAALITDLVSLRLGGRVRFFASRKHSLERLAERLSVSRSPARYNEINQIRRLAQHPLNLRPTLEDMLLRHVRAFSEAKT